MDTFTVYPKGTQGTIGEVTEEGIKAVQKNLQKVYKAYLENVKTLQEVNK